MPRARRNILMIQAGYYIVTGVWPLVSRRSFEAVTGRKTDWWLVEMVGLLALANGLTLAAALAEDRISAQTTTLALCSALSFAAIDTCYVMRRRISPVYLGDAAIEIALAAANLATRP